MSDKIITDKDVDKAKEYKDTLTDLQKAVSGLTFSMPKFSKGLQDGLEAIADKLPDVIDSISKLNVQNKELVASGQKPQSVLKQLASSLLSWNSVVSVGITLISVYGKEILSWVGSLLKGEQGLNSYSKAIKDSKLVLGALTEAQQNGNIAAQDELVKLKLLYTATQNHRLSINERKKASDELQKQYPGYFQNMSNEEIIAGKAAKAYETLSNAIIASARSRAAQEIMVKNQQRQLGNETRLTSLDAVKKTQENELNLVKARNKGLSNMQIIGGSSLTAGTGSKDTAGDAKIIRLSAALEKTNKQIADITEDSRILNKRNELLVKSVSEYTEKYGVKILTTIGQTNDGIIKSSQNVANHENKLIVTTTDNYIENITQQTIFTLNNYNEQVQAANKHYNALINAQKGNSAAVKHLENQKFEALKALAEKFRKDEMTNLAERQELLTNLAVEYRNNAQELAFRDLQKNYQEKQALLSNAEETSKNKLAEFNEQLRKIGQTGHEQEIEALKQKIATEEKLLSDAQKLKSDLTAKYVSEQQIISNAFESNKQKETLTNEIADAHDGGNWQIEFNKKQELLDIERNQAITAARLKGEAITSITREYNEKQRQLDEAKLDAEAESQKKYLKTISSIATAVMGIFGKNTIASRIAFKAQQAAAAGQVIIDTKRSIMGIWSANAGIPFVGVPKAIAETAVVAAIGASSLASIIKQKPGFATGGQFVSDGRGALLPGYSRTDNTNAYLRSGEAVVVSEAMRNPWARNLISAINVAHGGRDFSTRVTSSGYAVGGIFTDGGNANRYYTQPVNDMKELANTLAYQMINNFPPVYVDVKDINNQQSIMARTIDRVNL